MLSAEGQRLYSHCTLCPALVQQDFWEDIAVMTVRELGMLQLAAVASV